MSSFPRFSILVYLLEMTIPCFSNRVIIRNYELHAGERLQLTQESTQKSTQVKGANECVFSCTSTEWCLSINIRTTPLGLHVCELLSYDRFTNGTVMKKDDGYNHYSKKDKCRRDKPCRNGGQCVYYDDKQDYRCICRQGSAGRNCEIPASSSNVYTFNSSVFVLINLTKTWEDGRLHCQTFGADLASFHGEMESRLVLQTLLDSSPKLKFGDKEPYIVKLGLDGKDSSLILKNGAKYEETDQGSALYLDGVDDHVLVPRFVFYDKSFTFGVWVKLAVSKLHIIINDDTGNVNVRSFNFRISSAHKIEVNMWFGEGNHDTHALSDGVIPINQWTHIGITFDIDAHNITFYINGSLDKEFSGSSPSRNMRLYTPAHYDIGKVVYSSAYFFQGWMKDLLMISRILQPSEMKAIVDGERRAWIGFNDKNTEGVFQWSDGTSLTYNNLKPFNAKTRNCGTARQVEGFPYELSMRNCQEESFFICRK